MYISHPNCILQYHIIIHHPVWGFYEEKKLCREDATGVLNVKFISSFPQNQNMCRCMEPWTGVFQNIFVRTKKSKFTVYQ